MFTLAAGAILFFGWIVLSGKFDLFHLLLGAVSCLIVARLSQDLLFHERDKGLAVRISEAFRFIPYTCWLLSQIVLANFHVIALAVSPRYCNQQLDPHIFTFTTRLQSDFARFVLANSITLTPGTVTIRIEGDTFHVHAIDRKSSSLGDNGESTSIREMERRVARVFEGGGR